MEHYSVLKMREIVSFAINTDKVGRYHINRNKIKTGQISHDLTYTWNVREPNSLKKTLINKVLCS